MGTSVGAIGEQPAAGSLKDSYPGVDLVGPAAQAAEHLFRLGRRRLSKDQWALAPSTRRLSTTVVSAAMITTSASGAVPTASLLSLPYSQPGEVHNLRSFIWQRAFVYFGCLGFNSPLQG
jgi:hypothetical protein